MCDNIRKLKGTCSIQVNKRYHISILTILQPEDNYSVANTRASRSCPRPDAIAGKKISQLSIWGFQYNPKKPARAL